MKKKLTVIKNYTIVYVININIIKILMFSKTFWFNYYNVVNLKDKENHVILVASLLQYDEAWTINKK